MNKLVNAVKNLIQARENGDWVKLRQAWDEVGQAVNERAKQPDSAAVEPKYSPGMEPDDNSNEPKNPGAAYLQDFLNDSRFDEMVNAMPDALIEKFHSRVVERTANMHSWELVAENNQDDFDKCKAELDAVYKALADRDKQIEELIEQRDNVDSELNSALYKIQSSTKPPRITEQDAREIVDEFSRFVIQKTLPEHLNAWLESSYCNTLLSKLNENREPDAWTPSDFEYDKSIHSNPDAKAWSDLFVATFPRLADKHEIMLGWFANAMMAMHDHIKNAIKCEPDYKANEWQPIETAPKNGSMIWISDGKKITIALWYKGNTDDYWKDWFLSSQVDKKKLVAWMPLPNLPAIAKYEGK